MLTVGSLFAGIGGFDLGLERAGMKILWQVEIDEYCRRVLARHWPGVPRYADVRDCGAQNLAPVDLVCGGFPCQDISTAGAGLGLAGERSGLWREMRRIVGELRPKYVLVENVAALLYRGIGTVLGDLAALGFDAEWEVLPACAYGAPHIRERVWILAYPNTDSERCVFRVQGSPAKSDGDGNEPRRWFEELAGDTWGQSAEPVMAGVADGIPEYLDAYSHLGNAVVPIIPEWIGKRIIAAENAQ